MLKRWLLALSILFGLVGGLWFALPEAPASIRKGDMAKFFTLPDLHGKSSGLPSGKVVLLNFWATWCPPCRQEIPSMATLHTKYADQGLKVVAVSVDKNSDDLAGFVREYQLPFQVLHDADSHVAHEYGVYRYPESFLIDRNGKVRYHLIGAVDWMSPSVLKTIEGMLNEREVAGAGNG